MSNLRGRNYSALAAIGSSVWIAALSLAAVPVYLSRLGIEAYGVIGFFLSMQAILQVLDLGLAPAVNRELARTAALGELGSARTLLHTLSRIYWLMGLAIAAVFWLAASPIATAWLGVSRLTIEELTQALVLMGLVIAARWPIALYQNALIGLGNLGTASVVGAAMSTVTVGASVASVVFIAPNLQTLFVTQAIAALLYALVMRAMAWRAIGGHADSSVSLSSVQRIWKFSLGMGGVTLTGIALTQLDKALLSKLLPLASFGEYMLAATVVSGLAVVSLGPLFNVIYPRFSALVAGERYDALRVLYDDGSRLFSIIYLPLVIALGVYAYDIVWLWTGSADTASRVAPLVGLLCVGSAINGIMYFPYSLQLAHGLSRIPLLINGVLLVLLAPLIIVLTSQFGARGGAAAWATLQMLYLAFGTYVTHRSIRIGNGVRWVFRSVALPFFICGAIAVALHPIIAYAPSGSALKAAFIAISVFVPPLLCLLAFPSLRLTAGMRLNMRRTHPIHEHAPPH